jgi:hypothetical protein
MLAFHEDERNRNRRVPAAASVGEVRRWQKFMPRALKAIPSRGSIMSTDRSTSLKNSLHVRAPRSLMRAIRDAAARELMSPSEYTRRALVEKLRADGIDPAGYRPKSVREEDPDDDYPRDNQAPNAKGLGLAEPDRINPDMILASVEADPEVREAGARWDAATPDTHYDLVRARDEAQARMGIPAANRAFLYSAEIDSYLIPIVMRMGPGDEAMTAQALSRDFSERYRNLGPTVLAFCLSTYQHGNIDGLKRAAGVA